MVQWLRFRDSNAGDMGSTPGQGIRIMHATQHGQKKKEKVESCQRTGKSESESVSHSVVSNSLRPHGL